MFNQIIPSFFPSALRRIGAPPVPILASSSPSPPGDRSVSSPGFSRRLRNPTGSDTPFRSLWKRTEAPKGFRNRRWTPRLQDGGHHRGPDAADQHEDHDVLQKGQVVGKRGGRARRDRGRHIGVDGPWKSKMDRNTFLARAGMYDNDPGRKSAPSHLFLDSAPTLFGTAFKPSPQNLLSLINPTALAPCSHQALLSGSHFLKFLPKGPERKDTYTYILSPKTLLQMSQKGFL